MGEGIKILVPHPEVGEGIKIVSPSLYGITSDLAA